MPENNPILGLALLYDDLFVCYRGKPLSVYHKQTYRLQRTVAVPGLNDAQDMTSCQRHRCVYVSDHARNVIHRVDHNYQVSQWPAYDQPDGLSVNTLCNVLVTCQNACKLKEFKTDGTLLREISLLSDIINPSHAVELTTDLFVVCHGLPLNSLRRVCVVNSEGDIVNFDDGSLMTFFRPSIVPLRLIANGFVLVSEVNEGKVLVLTPTMKLVCEVVSGQRTPFRMCIDSAAARLYVADCRWEYGDLLSGRINVYSFSCSANIRELHRNIEFTTAL